MPTYKVSFEFASRQQKGWTEDYFRQGTSAQVAASLALDDAQFYMAHKAASTTLIEIRASNPLVPFDAYPNVLSEPIAGGRPLPTAVNTDKMDLINACAQVRLPATNGHSGIHYLRGLLDRDVAYDDNGRPAPTAAFRSALTKFFSTITLQPAGSTFGMYTPTRVPAPGARSIIAEITGNANPFWTNITTTTVLAGAQVGAAIQINRVPQNELPALKGLFRIMAFDNTSKTYTIQYRWRRGSVSITPANAYATIPTFEFNAFAEGFKFLRWGTRKTGRPIERSVGRARPVVRRQ